MSIAFNIPDGLERALRARYGSGLEAVARDALVAEAYRLGELTVGEVADLLGQPTRLHAEAWLAERGVRCNLRASDLDDDRRTLSSLPGPSAP